MITSPRIDWQPRAAPTGFVAELEQLRARLRASREPEPFQLYAEAEQPGDELARATLQVRYAAGPWRLAAREALERALVGGESITDAEQLLISLVEQETGLQRAEVEQLVRQDVVAAVAASRPPEQTPEIVAAMPTGAEQAQAILPATAPAPAAAVPAPSLPAPDAEQAATVTAAPPRPAPPGAWLGATVQPVAPALPPPQVFVPPAAVAPPNGRKLPWLHLGLGVSMAAVGIYLMARKKKG